MKITEGQHMRKGRILRRIHAQDGFSLVEVMIAVLILTVGLTGAAAMQINALKGVFLASAYTNGAGVSQAWMEWFSGLISQREQETNQSPAFNGKWVNNNFLQLSALDTNPNDGAYTVVHPDCSGGTCSTCTYPDKDAACIVMPTTIAGIKGFLTAKKFTNAPSDGHSAFDAASVLPPMPPAGSYMVWRIAANVPAENVTTIQVSILYRNAFVTDNGATLTLVLSSFD